MSDKVESEPAVTAEEAVEMGEGDLGRHRDLPRGWWIWLVGCAFLSVFTSVYIIFGLGNVFGTYVPLETEYFYVMLGLLLPLVFLLYPPLKGVGPMTSVPFYDIVLAAAAFGISVYFVMNGDPILNDGWEFLAPPGALICAFIMWGLVLEAVRRAGGHAIFVICVVASIYPVFTHLAPSFLHGESVEWSQTAAFHIFGTESVLGIPMKAFATLVVGFLVFGVALQYTGGGAFFLNLAFAMLGQFRGGPAKVAIFASGLMGSMSGSVITNVMTTGVMSIPTMKRVGFSPAYAGGVEACASTGGVFMPPVMGATAFVMATFIEVPYAEIVVAAVFPSLLYYLGLFIQIDAYAARHGLKGLPQAELPRMGEVMKDGWYFIAVFVLLIVMLLYMQREAQAPYYATALLLVINQFNKNHRWDKAKLIDFMVGVGKLFTELAAILAGIGLIIGSLTLTGKVGSLAYDLVSIAGDNVFLLLLMGAVTSFVLGMGMTITAAYLFLAVTLAPALTTGGLDKLAVHLFIMYWGMISFITPPVAIGAYAASSIAKSNPMRTGLEAMRLGTVIYFVPFFFVLNPALIGKGTFMEVVLVFGAAVVGVFFVACGLQGFLVGIGRLTVLGVLGMVARVLFVAAGLIMMLPGGDLVGYTNVQINLTALALLIPAFLIAVIGNRGGRGRKTEPIETQSPAE